MATYYYSESGDDTILNAANASSTPFKSSNRAMVECTANDTISFVGTQSAPCRSVLDTTRLPAGATTINIDGNNGYLLGTVDVSDGATFFADDLQSFCLSNTEFAGQSGTVADEGTEFASGGASVYFNGTAAQSFGYIESQWTGETRIHVTYKNVTDALQWRWEQDGAGFYWRESDKTWVATAATNTFTPTDAVNFITTTTPWIPAYPAAPAHPRYRFWMFQNTGDAAYVDQIRFECRVSWNTTGDEWECLFPIPSGVTPRLMKCTTTDWNANGQTSLRNITKGTVGALNAGEFGVDIDLHFEVNRYLANTLDQNCIASDITKVSGTTWGFNLSGGTPILNNIHVDRAQIRGFVASSTSTPEANVCSVTNIEGDGAANHGEGFFSMDTSVFTVNGGDATEIEDECYQPADLSYMKLNGCTGKSTGASGNVFEANFTDAQGAQSCGWDIMNSTFIVENSTSGALCVKIENDGTTAYSANMTNSIFVQNDSVAGGANMASANVTLTASDNTFTGSYTGDAAAWSGETAAQALINFGGTEVTTADAGIDTTDYTLSATSTLVGTGVKWWTGVRPVSASGEPYPDFDIDPGGVQSTHSPHHPSNQ
jgi:hypothetical protein